MYRQFDGMRYKETTFSTNKKDAEYIKNQWKKNGYNVRIVKCKNGYKIYTRKK